LLRFEAPDEELFKAIKPFFQGLFPDSFLSEQIRLLGDTAFSYAYGEGRISKAEFQKDLVSWLEGMIKALAPEIKRELTEKQRAFVEHFILCGNGSEAARKAGYSQKMANRIAYQLLRKPLVKQEIDRARRDRADGEL